MSCRTFFTYRVGFSLCYRLSLKRNTFQQTGYSQQLEKKNTVKTTKNKYFSNSCAGWLDCDFKKEKKSIPNYQQKAIV